MSDHDDTTHGPVPLRDVDRAPLHAAVDALAAALHEYVDTAVGVRAEFGASEADEDPRILALESRIAGRNADVFDALHTSLGMHPDLNTLTWGDADAHDHDHDGADEPLEAEVFYLGFVVTPPTRASDTTMGGVIGLLDEAGEATVQRLGEAGFEVVEWAASRGEPDLFDDDDDEDDA
ncbi:hypothetical protein [Luteimicrobium subarcticum]|uniref:Uncharacterized protein n=1 Tax=Luteimicrobium subarcticum TaxID=620910 RepID=A0A2M8WUE5_9MICO|nr:hypothetical protein [Luteimicrobium subarcticum]PJI94565.1 hypothetical protein CLV34_0409 [Luteimicrobium subarcticum]